ncbi:MAG: hypothetical protein ACXWCQ_33315 [Burkholderiales bacterium]
MSQTIIERAARTLRKLLVEHRDDFDARMAQHIAIVATNGPDADTLNQGVAQAVPSMRGGI